jgi:hypothetical protein
MTIGIKGIQDKLEGYYYDYYEKVDQYLAFLRDKYLIPFCDKYGIQFLAGNGTWLLSTYTTEDDQWMQIDADGVGYTAEYFSEAAMADIKEIAQLLRCMYIDGDEIGPIMKDYTPASYGKIRHKRREGE